MIDKAAETIQLVAENARLIMTHLDSLLGKTR
jgi:hypothetical protein